MCCCNTHSHGFRRPHKVLEPDAAAKKLLQATCTLCNIKASLASEEGDYDCAARWGAGPWKVGVLAGLLFGFDVFVGQIDPATVAASPRLSLQREHIRRARELHGLLEHMRAAWAVNSDAFTAPEQVLLQDPEFVAGLAPGMGGCRPRKRATARSSRRRRRLLQRMPFALLGIGEQCLQRGNQAN